MTGHEHLSVGAIFGGDYRIVKPLSAGGMGAVYVVEQLSTAKLRALKLMHPQLVANADLRRRFEQEAKIGARIESEHVVEVQAAGIDAASGIPYLVMELLEGEDLAATIQRRGRLTTDEVGAIFEQLCHAMGAAHAAGIVHRDLKPENVFLAPSKRAGAPFTVKVLDFGIAKLVAEGHAKSTAAMGSPMWLAPEQTERQPVGPPTDVWALGLIAFYLLSGFPFWRVADEPNPTVTQVLREIIFEPIPLASARAAQRGVALPAGFDGWFSRCVARDVRARFPHAGAALAELAPLLQPSSTRPAPSALATAATLLPSDQAFAGTPYPQTPPPLSQSGTSSSGSGGWIWLAAGAVLCLAVATAGGLYAFRAKLMGIAAEDTPSTRVEPTAPLVDLAPSASASAAATAARPTPGSDYVYLAPLVNHSGKANADAERLFTEALRAELHALGIESTDANATADSARATIAEGNLVGFELTTTLDVTNDAQGRHAKGTVVVTSFPARNVLATLAPSATMASGKESDDAGLFGALARNLATTFAKNLPDLRPTKPPAATGTAAAQTTAAQATTPKAPPPTGPSLADQARAKITAGDNQGARTLLEPRVFSGKASAEERDLLKAVCRTQGDKACVDMIATKYPPPPATTAPCGCNPSDLACAMNCGAKKKD